VNEKAIFTTPLRENAHAETFMIFL
jgi:hypothetical protein